jgi:predicted ATPase/DNA-binding CsgD family transcriptional regulator
MRASASLHSTQTVSPKAVPSPGKADRDSFVLPQPLTSFVGREREIPEIAAQLRRSEIRLVTLTGPGGVGKTRLALNVAHSMEHELDLGVCFVPLAAIVDADLVAPVIGQAVGLERADASTLPERLSVVLNGREMLLVLDNFEQILAAASLIARIVEFCPALKVLVTSRAPLQLTLEHELPVGPLGLPQSGSPTDDISVTPAVQLFIERAKLKESELTAEDVVSIADVCRRLDGLPLAIELAAANARVMSPAELALRMDRTLPLLTGGPRDAPARLQTMRNAIAWSYDLLSTDEQALFRSLSVFQGGFTLDAAEAIAPPSLTAPVLSLFHALVASNLVLRIGPRSDPGRFTMLETVKEFGLEVLAASGEETAIRDRHLAWFAASVGAPQLDRWFDPRWATSLVLPGEQDNLRSALNWALERGKTEQAGQVALALLPYLRRNGLFAEIATNLDRVANQCKSTDPMLFAGVTNASAQFLWQLGDIPKSRDHAIASLEVCRDIGDPVCVRAGLVMLGTLTVHSDGESAVELLTEAIEISRRLKDTWHLALDLRFRARIYFVLGDMQRAKQDVAEALPLLRETPDSQPQLVFAMLIQAWIAAQEQDFERAEQLGQETLALASEFDLVECQSLGHQSLGDVALARNAHQAALTHFQEALRLAYRSGLELQEGFCYHGIAVVAQAQRDFDRSFRLFGAADANWARFGFSNEYKAKAICAVQFLPSQENPESERFASEFLAGQALSRQEAYTLAMTMIIPATAPQIQSPLLSQRQREVLQLVASGYSNREIAEILFVSKRTIDSHVLSILSKLGVDSRRDAVTRARELGLLDL